MNTSLLLLSFLATAAPQSEASTDGWPNHLGPNFDGKTALGDVSFDWGDDGPEIAWRLDVGPGFGGASIRDGQVFLLDREVGEVDILRVLELDSGETVWDAIYEAPGRLMYAGSRTVPTVTEEHVYTCGGQGRVVCWDRESREEVWSAPLDEWYGGVNPGYGWSGSPLVVGDKLIVAAHGTDVALVAFDRNTGDELWVTEPAGVSHSTPALLNLLGEEQIVYVSSPISADASMSLTEAGTFLITSYNPEDGSTLWSYETLGSTYPIPGPVQVGDDRFFITGGYRGGSSMIRIAKAETGYTFEREFRIERGSQIHNPILHGDHLYMIVNENYNEPRNLRAEGGLMCLTLDGKEKWRTKDDPYLGRGHWFLAGDYLFVQDGLNGTLRIVEATPEEYREVASANLFGITDRRDHQMWAPMAYSNGFLLMRSQEELLCVKL